VPDPPIKPPPQPHEGQMGVPLCRLPHWRVGMGSQRW